MKKPDLGQTINTLANIGVIAGILFLGYELRQNNQLLASEAQAARLESRESYYELYLQNSDVLQAIVRADRGEELSDEDRRRLEFLSLRLFIAWQFAFRSYQQGIVEEQSLPIAAWIRDLAGDGDVPMMKDFWDEHSIEFDSDFVEFVERRLLSVAGE